MGLIKIATFSSQLEAQMAAESLLGHGVHAEVVGSKEYTSHVMGSDIGSFVMLVESEQSAVAETLLKKAEIKLVDQEPTTIAPESYLKKSFLFAILAIVMIPVLSNYLSLKYAWHYLRLGKKTAKKYFLVILIVFLQIPGFLSFYILYKSIPW